MIYRRTEPEAFFMDVYFNAHPVSSPSQAEGKPKLKTPNALIPTVIPYAGGQVEFAVNMGADARTPLYPLSLALTDPASLPRA